MTNYTNTNFHSTTMASSIRLGTGIPIRGQLFCIMGPELSTNQLRVYFGIFSDSWYHAPDKFSGWIESLLLSIKWLTSNIRQNRNNFHLMWESTIATISSWASTAWAQFPRPVCVTIRRNLIGLPLLRVVNNSDRWMRKAWEWREASHVVRTRFGTGL